MDTDTSAAHEDRAIAERRATMCCAWDRPPPSTHAEPTAEGADRQLCALRAPVRQLLLDQVDSFIRGARSMEPRRPVRLAESYGGHDRPIHPLQPQAAVVSTYI